MPRQDVPVDRLPVHGVLDQDLTADGVVLRRLPAWTRPQLVEPAQEIVSTMPAGGVIRFRTASRVLELDAMLTVLRIRDQERPSPVFDLVVDDVVVAAAVADDVMTYHLQGYRPEDLVVVPGGPDTLRFELPGSTEQVVEIWLPHDTVVEVRGVRIDEGTTLEPVDRARRRWVHHGSSISHCLEAPRPTETWPALVARRAGVDSLNLGLGGQCMLDQFVARTIRDERADLLSLKVGINVVNGDTMRERTFRPALHGFLDTVRDGHPDTPFLVVTPIICPAAEESPGPSVLGDDGRYGVVPRPVELAAGALTLRRVREIVTEVVTVRQQAGDAHLHLLDGLTLFGERDADLLPDALHPNAEGYQRIADRFHSAAFDGGPFAERR
ncbi:MAG: lipase [Frankiales bacterium]|nr:MAG: lipase [Frankiales bacterium]